MTYWLSTGSGTVKHRFKAACGAEQATALRQSLAVIAPAPFAKAFQDARDTKLYNLLQARRSGTAITTQTPKRGRRAIGQEPDDEHPRGIECV
jgi:hypothetical protein